MFFFNAFSSELDRCCCIWHLVLLITNKPLEHDFLRKLCVKLVCEIVTKWFVCKHGQLEHILQWVLPYFTCKLQQQYFPSNLFFLSSPLFPILLTLWFSCIHYLCLLGYVLHGVLDHGYHCNGWPNIFLMDKNCNMVININLIITTANAKLLNNINSWSGNPGTNILAVIIHLNGAGDTGKIPALTLSIHFFFFMMFGFKKEIFGNEGKASCKRRETERKENRNKCRKIA